MRLEKEISLQTKSNKYAHRHKCTHRSTHEFLHIAVGCPFWHTVSFFLSFRTIHTPQCMYVQLCVSIVFKGLVHVSVCNCVFLLLCVTHCVNWWVRLFDSFTPRWDVWHLFSVFIPPWRHVKACLILKTPLIHSHSCY